MCVIAVSKSHEYVLKFVDFLLFFDDDAYAFTSLFFLRRRKGFDFDDESAFFPRRRTLYEHVLILHAHCLAVHVLSGSDMFRMQL